MKNPQYTCAKAIRFKKKNLGIRTYKFNSFTPEIIWDYETSIPILLNEKTNKLYLPSESKFGLLVLPIDSLASRKKKSELQAKKGFVYRYESRSARFKKTQRPIGSNILSRYEEITTYYLPLRR